jgi:hypothetical protein
LWMKQETLPVLQVTKPVPKKGISNKTFIDIASKFAVVVEDDKENYIPSTPKKSDTNTFQTTLGLPSPLSPSKRGINQNAPESPTKRLQTGMKQMMMASPPTLNLPVIKARK